MKNSILFLSFLIVGTILLNCSKEQAIITKSLSEVSGTYIGIIPCADCEGIKYELQLSEDSLCLEEMMYIGKSDEQFKSYGKWELLTDSTIRATIDDEKKFFLIKDNHLILLDRKGKRIKSEMEGMYALMLTDDTPGEMIPANMYMGRMRMMSMPANEIKPDFTAHGNEPFWNLTLNFETGILFSTMEGMTIELPEFNVLKTPGTAITRMEGKSKNNQLVVSLQPSECSDGMADEQFENSVTVQVFDKDGNETDTYTGCGNYTPDPRLQDSWVLTHVNGIAPDQEKLNGGEVPGIEFYSDEKRVGGFAGCNNFNGSFHIIDKNELQFGMLAMTRKMCPHMEMEKLITSLISSKNYHYYFDQLNLVLSGADGTTISFKKVD